MYVYVYVCMYICNRLRQVSLRFSELQPAPQGCWRAPIFSLCPGEFCCSAPPTGNLFTGCTSQS